MPLVSIITPAFNSAATLNRCHASVQAQTLTDWEHIIVDDGSSDQTPRMLNALAAEDERVRVLCNDGNQGAARARNRGIEAARGRFVAFIDADDEWLPAKLQAQIEFMMAENVAFSYGAYYVAEGPGQGSQLYYEPPPSIGYAMLLSRCPIGCLTAAYDRERCGAQLMPDVRRGQDWGLWLALTRQNAIEARKYPGTHAIYHRTPGSVSSGKLRKMRDVWQIYRQCEGLPLTRAALNLLRLSVYSFQKYPSRRG